jgi:hypothetical protein
MELEEKVRKLAAEYADKPWTEWPTVREIAKRFKTTQNSIISIAEDSEELDLIVGMRCGNGMGEFDNKGDYKIEHLYADPLTVKAEVFKVIRANTEKSKNAIIKLIYKHLPDVPRERIAEALKELSDGS